MEASHLHSSLISRTSFQKQLVTTNKKFEASFAFPDQQQDFLPQNITSLKLTDPDAQIIETFIKYCRNIKKISFKILFSFVLFNHTSTNIIPEVQKIQSLEELEIKNLTKPVLSYIFKKFKNLKTFKVDEIPDEESLIYILDNSSHLKELKLTLSFAIDQEICQRIVKTNNLVYLNIKHSFTTQRSILKYFDQFPSSLKEFEISSDLEDPEMFITKISKLSYLQKITIDSPSSTEKLYLLESNIKQFRCKNILLDVQTMSAICGKNPLLEAIKFDYCTDSLLNIVSKHSQNLKRIELQRSNVSVGMWKQFVNNKPNLLSLSLKGSILDNKILMVISSSLTQLKQLQIREYKDNLDRCGFSNLGIIYLGKLCHTLRKINLNLNQLTTKSVSRVFGNLKRVGYCEPNKYKHMLIKDEENKRKFKQNMRQGNTWFRWN